VGLFLEIQLLALVVALRLFQSILVKIPCDFLVLQNLHKFRISFICNCRVVGILNHRIVLALRWLRGYLKLRDYLQSNCFETLSPCPIVRL